MPILHRDSSYRLVALLLFFVSGAAGLIYEVGWMRYLSAIFGSTLYAISTVVAAFMGGLALGSWFGGRIADRSSNLLRTYAIIEAGIGISAALVLYLIDAAETGIIESLYSGISRVFRGSFTGITSARLGVNFLLLLVPTSLMGATLPILARFTAHRSSEIGPLAGWLYAVNTMGAVVGCLWAGFWGIADFGLRETSSLAIAGNLAVGLTSFLLSIRLRKAQVAVSEPADMQVIGAGAGPQAPYPAPIRLFVMAAFGISGFVALGCQVLWNRSLIFSFWLMSNTTYVFTSILAVFLTGLFVGSAMLSAVAPKIRSPLRAFALIQILIGLSTALSAHLALNVLPGFDFIDAVDKTTLRADWVLNSLNILGKIACAVALPTLLMGASFPLAVMCCVAGSDRMGYGVGRVYAFNTLGAIAGAVLTSFLLIPLTGITRTMFLFSGASILLGAFLVSLDAELPRAGRRLFASMAFAAAVVVVTFAPKNATLHRGIQEYIYSGEWPTVVYYEEGPQDTISVLQDRFLYRTLYVDGMGVASTNRAMLTDQKTLAHLPMLLLRNPRSALAFGFGSGGTAWSFLQYRDLEKLDVVEISPTITKAAPFLERSNHGVLREPTDPRLTVIREDARSHIRMTGVKYDIIEIDCTDLTYKGSGSVHT